MNIQERQKKIHLSTPERRDIMWNIIEPGDPYDIRKSMIAKLPGRKNFMGPHLELVCLLQAAEIERLIENLEDYKVKYRENERVSLDRHSYEVQIKELTQQLSDDGSFKLQNSKLREFLRKQSNELEQMRRQAVTGQFERQLLQKYEEVLRNLQILRQQNQSLNSTNNFLIEQNRQLKEKNEQSWIMESGRKRQIKDGNESQLQSQFKRLEFEYKRIRQINETKNKEIEQLQRKYRQIADQSDELRLQNSKLKSLSHSIREYESRFSILGEEIERLNSVLRDKAGQLNDLYSKYRSLELQDRRKAQYINEVQLINKNMDESVRMLEKKNRQMSASKHGEANQSALIESYEGHLEKLSVEVARLNTVLRSKVEQLEASKKINGELQYNLKKIQFVVKQNEEFKFRYGEFNKKLLEYERKIVESNQQTEKERNAQKRMNEQIISLSSKLSEEQRRNQQLQKKLFQFQNVYREEKGNVGKQLQKQANELIKQIEQLKLKNKQLMQNNEKQQQFYQQKIIFYGQQIQRLTGQIGKVQPLNIKLTDSIARQQSLEIKKQQKIKQYENKIYIYSQQIQRLNNNIKFQGADVNELNKRNAELLEQIRRLGQINHEKDYDLNYLHQQNQQLKQQIYNQSLQTSERTKKSIEDSNKVYIQEIDRLGAELKRASISEGIDAQNLIGQREELRKQNLQYQSQIMILKGEIERLKSVLNDKLSNLGQLQYQLGALINQNNLVKEYNKVIPQYQQKLMEQQQSIQQLINKNHQLLAANQRLQQINLKASRNSNLISEIQQLNRKVLQKDNTIINLERGNTALSVQINNYKDNIQILTSQISNPSNQLEAKIKLLQKEKQQLRFELKDYDELTNKMNVFSTQIQRLNGVLRAKLAENAQIEAKVKSLSYENQQLKRRMYETQSSQSKGNQQMATNYEQLLSKHQLITKQQKTLQSKNKQLNQQNENKILQLKDYENKIRLQNSQIERLTNSLHGRINDMTNYEASVKKLLQRNQQLQIEAQEGEKYRKMVTNYQDKLGLLSGQVERLNKVLKGKNEEIRNYQNQFGDQLQDYKRKMRELSSSSQKQIIDYEDKIAVLTLQVDRLNKRLKQKEEQLDVLQQEEQLLKNTQRALKKQNDEKLAQSERVLQFERKNNQQKFNNQAAILSQYEDKLISLSQQVERLNKILQQNDRIIEGERRLKEQSIEEIERLNNILRLKVEESALKQISNKDLQNKLRHLSSQSLLSSQQYEKLKNRYNELLEQYSKNKGHLSNYQLSIKNLYQQVERLQAVMIAIKQESSQMIDEKNTLIQKNRRLGAEVDRLTEIVDHQNSELQDLRLKVSNDLGLQKRVQQHLGLMVIMFAQIESLRDNIRNKQKEVEQIRRDSLSGCRV